MALEENDPNEIAEAWLNQMEYAVKRTESLAAFYRISVDERRFGEEVDSFFHGKAALELIDSQAYLQMLTLQWERVKVAIDFSKVSKRSTEKILAAESRMKSALKQGQDIRARGSGGFEMF